MRSTGGLTAGIVLLDRPMASAGRMLHHAAHDELVCLTIHKARLLTAPTAAANDVLASGELRVTVGDANFALLYDLRAGLQIPNIPVAAGEKIWAAVSVTDAFVVYGHYTTCL